MDDYQEKTPHEEARWTSIIKRDKKFLTRWITIWYSQGENCNDKNDVLEYVEVIEVNG